MPHAKDEWEGLNANQRSQIRHDYKTNKLTSAELMAKWGISRITFNKIVAGIARVAPCGGVGK